MKAIRVRRRVHVSVEQRPIVVIGRDWIDAEKPSRDRVVVPLLHVDKPGIWIVGMPGVADTPGHGTCGRRTEGFIVRALDDLPGAARAHSR